MTADPQSASWKALKKHFEGRIEKLHDRLEKQDDPEARGAIKEIRKTIALVENPTVPVIASDDKPLYT